MRKLVHHEEGDGWNPLARKKRKKNRKRQSQSQGVRVLTRHYTKRPGLSLEMGPCLAEIVMRNKTIETSQEPIRISANLGKLRLNHYHPEDLLLLRLLAKPWHRREWYLFPPLLPHEKVERQSYGPTYSSLSPGHWRMPFIWLRHQVAFTLQVSSVTIV